MQPSIEKLVKMGVFPKSEDAIKDPNGYEYIDNIQSLIDSIKLPISNDDDYFGLTQTLLQKIETAPDWPIKELFIDNNYWMGVLKSRARFI